MPQHLAGLLQHGSRQLEHKNRATRAHGEAEERDSDSVDADKDTEAERLYAAAHKGQVEAGHEAHESHEGHEEDEDARKDTAKETALGQNKMMQLFGSKVSATVASEHHPQHLYLYYDVQKAKHGIRLTRSWNIGSELVLTRQGYYCCQQEHSK